MAIPTEGNISIKEAAGSTRSIDTAVTSTSSGSLVTLGQNSINYTGGRSSITNDTDASPYSMLEYAGYTHTQTMPMTETFFTRNSSAGIAALSADYSFTSTCGALTGADTSATIRAQITNTGTNSVFSLHLFENSGYYWDYKYSANGTQSTWVANTGFQIYTAAFSGSFYPDTFNIDYTMSTSSTLTLLSTAVFSTVTSGSNVGSAYWIDNTDHTYNATAGTHYSGRRWVAATQNYPPANYGGGHGRIHGFVDFNVTFKKSGYFDKTASGGGFQLKLISEAESTGC